MSGEQIAEHLGVSRNTVVRELTLARAWLRRRIAKLEA
jgi:biotin operon repressor